MDKKPVFLVGGQHVNANGKPVNQDGSAINVESGSSAASDQVEALTKERDELKETLKRQDNTADRKLQEWQQLANINGAKVTDLTLERDELKGQLQRLTTEHESLQVNMDNTQKGYADYHAETQEQLAALTTERDAAQKALAAAKIIPEDALVRLEGVKGIGKDLAQKGLDALTAAPAKPEK